jgi:hemerythrin superfamily protein
MRRAECLGMDALELLKQQHDEVDELIADIEETDDDEEKGQLFEELADSLAAHAKIEEEIFYPAVMAKQTEDILLESAEEHLAIKRVLADMLELDASDEQFDTKLSVMKEQITHHAREEEEGELFPKVRKLLDKDELLGLGNEMMTRFAQLMGEEPRLEVPNETDKAAPLAH